MMVRNIFFIVAGGIYFSSVVIFSFAIALYIYVLSFSCLNSEMLCHTFCLVFFSQEF